MKRTHIFTRVCIDEASFFVLCEQQKMKHIFTRVCIDEAHTEQNIKSIESDLCMYAY